ncbi:thioredoxin family protein [Desulfovibrio sp. OttesenSCG-928-F07]|nr:thioredoxin family protein [Desulfovibrio sp. OttesenSCG-928-F07]
MNIKVFGAGSCTRCADVESLVRAVVAENGIDAEIEKVTDIKQMMSAGILSAPAVTIDGVIKISGRIPVKHEVEGWFKNI